MSVESCHILFVAVNIAFADVFLKDDDLEKASRRSLLVIRHKALQDLEFDLIIRDEIVDVKVIMSQIRVDQWLVSDVEFVPPLLEVLSCHSPLL